MLAGDRLLLFSDGLTEMVTNEAIATFFARNRIQRLPARRYWRGRTVLLPGARRSANLTALFDALCYDVRRGPARIATLRLVMRSITAQVFLRLLRPRVTFRSRHARWCDRAVRARRVG